VRTLAQGVAFEQERQRRESERQRHKALKEAAPYLQGPTYTNSSALRANRYLARHGPEGAAAAAAAAAKAEPDGAPPKERKEPAAGVQGSFFRGRQVPPLDISGLPGAEALAPREAEVCAAFRVVPAQYLAIKATLLLHKRDRGGLRRDEVAGLYPADALKLQKIWDVLQGLGLL